MYAKKKLATAVAIAAGSIAIGGMQAVQADSVFFPHLVGSNTITSIVSVINTADGIGLYPGSKLHYTMYSKNDPADKVCTEYNVFLPTSKNDIQTIDIAGLLDKDGELGVLFDDPSINNKWKQANEDYALGRALGLPFRGYMIVDNAVGADPVKCDDGDRCQQPVSTVRGEVFMFDYSAGAAWGYQGFTQNGDDPAANETYAGSEFDYSYAKTASGIPVNMLPFDEFSTAFLVTPVNINNYDAFETDWQPENMRPFPVNDYDAQIAFVTPTYPQGSSAALYDRDENPVSGSLPANVHCIGRVEAQSLLTAATANRLVKGGWGNLVNRRVNVKDVFTGSVLPPNLQPGFDDRTGAVIYKVEYNLGPVFNGQPVNGVFNSGMLLLPQFFDNNTPDAR